MSPEPGVAFCFFERRALLLPRSKDGRVSPLASPPSPFVVVVVFFACVVAKTQLRRDPARHLPGPPRPRLRRPPPNRRLCPLAPGAAATRLPGPRIAGPHGWWGPPTGCAPRRSCHRLSRRGAGAGEGPRGGARGFLGDPRHQSGRGRVCRHGGAGGGGHRGVAGEGGRGKKKKKRKNGEKKREPAGASARDGLDGKGGRKEDNGEGLKGRARKIPWPDPFRHFAPPHTLPPLSPPPDPSPSPFLFAHSAGPFLCSRRQHPRAERLPPAQHGPRCHDRGHHGAPRPLFSSARMILAPRPP